MNEAKSTLRYAEAIYFYHNDHLGTPQMMTDDDGDVVWDAAYEPFGKINSFESTPTITSNFRFPGQYEDAMTGMYYNHHRYYMPELGRYNRFDEKTLKIQNIVILYRLEVLPFYSYTYSRNNPNIMIDPEGDVTMPPGGYWYGGNTGFLGILLEQGFTFVLDCRDYCIHHQAKNTTISYNFPSLASRTYGLFIYTKKDCDGYCTEWFYFGPIITSGTID